MLLTAADQIPGASAEDVARRFWSSVIPVDQAMAATLGPPEIAVAVVVNHGRWVVECPDCANAQMACGDDRRFMCNLCANVGVDGLWRAVVWPEEWAEIDQVLTPRPIEHRNWLPGETLADLSAEVLAELAAAEGRYEERY